MAVVEELVALLGYELEGEGNLKRFTAGLDKAEKSARGNAVQLGRLDGASRKGARSVGRFGVVAGKTSTLLKGLGAAAVGTFAADSFKDFASFDRRMTLIGINAEASAEQTANAAERVRGLANRFAAPINDAVTGLETLVASGKSLDEALAFLPSVLMVSTATASATEDVANTALKTADALKLSAKDVAYMFDIMVTSGKDGQFELRDMAQYLPVVANMFAAAGYEGLPGLKALVSYLQTLREDSGSAGQAITQFTNILSKLESPRTLKTFEDHGIDLRKELEAARASGEDVIQVVRRLIDTALKGDYSKLADLFEDTQVRQGWLSLLTSAEAYEKFRASVDQNIEGAGLKDFARVADDATSSITRLGNTYDELKSKFGEKIAAPVLQPLLDGAVAATDGASDIFSTYVSEALGPGFEAIKKFPGTFYKYAIEGETPPGAPAPKPLRSGSEVTLPVAPPTSADSVAMSAGTVQIMSPLPTPSDANGGGALADLKARLDQLSPAQAAEKTVQDNRNQSMTNSITVNQTVTQVSEAPGAAAQATGSAVAAAASAQRSQIESSPAQ